MALSVTAQMDTTITSVPPMLMNVTACLVFMGAFALMELTG